MFPYFVPATPDLPADSGVTLTGIAKILALIGTLFAVLNAPTGISQLIGSDLSVSSALQSLQTTMIGSSLLGAAGRILGGTAKDAGALTAYGGGRLLGGSSIGKQMENMANGSEGGLSPLVSDRAAFGGIQGGIESVMSSNNPGITDFAAGFAANGLPNIAKPISELNASSGSMRDIISNPNYSGFEKFSRMGMKVTGWGASSAYAAASNRVASIGRRDMRSYRSPMNTMMMINAANTQNGGEQS